MGFARRALVQMAVTGTRREFMEVKTRPCVPAAAHAQPPSPPLLLLAQSPPPLPFPAPVPNQTRTLRSPPSPIVSPLPPRPPCDPLSHIFQPRLLPAPAFPSLSPRTRALGRAPATACERRALDISGVRTFYVFVFCGELGRVPGWAVPWQPSDVGPDRQPATSASSS